MKKYLIIMSILALSIMAAPQVNAKSANSKDITIKNRLFSLSIPKELKGTYKTKTNKNTVEVFDKTSAKAGFGGFAFGIRAYKNPSEHATLPGSRKIGELTDKKGILYDVVLKHPTDVQYDYTKEEVPNSFKSLYELGDKAKINGVNGAKYFKDKGTKGKDLYKDVLKKHISVIKEHKDSDNLEDNDMSYMYNVLAQSKADVLNKIGYAYYDVNADGIDELFIGEIAEGNLKGVIYDIYTMVDRKPKHVISGGARNRYYVCDDVFMCNEYSSGALESGIRVYALLENAVELYPQVSFKYDGYENKSKPWFISYGSEVNDDKWENVDEQTFNERKSTFDRYLRFDFTPLSSLEGE